MAKVLIVDDSRFMLKTMRTLLEKAGHEVVAEASDGIHAYVEYEKHRPDLVTLDLNMPLLCGMDTIEAILSTFADARIIVVTSEQKQDTIIECIKKGAKHYIIKPVTHDNLIAALDKVL